MRSIKRGYISTEAGDRGSQNKVLDLLSALEQERERVKGVSEGKRCEVDQHIMEFFLEA
jgi:hypothetical protein